MKYSDRVILCGIGRFGEPCVFSKIAHICSARAHWLLSRYHFSKHVLLDLCRDAGPLLERETKRTKAIPVRIQLLSTMGFPASFQHAVGEISGTVGWTYFPDPELHPGPRHPQQAELKRELHAVARFPNPFGALDCAIKAILTNDQRAQVWWSRIFFLNLLMHIINSSVRQNLQSSLALDKWGPWIPLRNLKQYFSPDSLGSACVSVVHHSWHSLHLSLREIWILILSTINIQFTLLLYIHLKGATSSLLIAE